MKNDNPIFSKLQETKTLIAAGRLEDGIKLMLQIEKKEIEPYDADIIQISARFQRFSQEKNRGIYSNSEITTHLNQITADLLNVIHNIEVLLQVRKSSAEYQINPKDLRNDDYIFLAEQVFSKDVHQLTDILTCGFFPTYAHKVPFGRELEDLFFGGIPNDDEFVIHGPNVVRFTIGILESDGGIGTSQNATGLFGNDSNLTSLNYILNTTFFKENGIAACLFDNYKPESEEYKNEKQKMIKILSVAALYHDIGKFIRRANHPLLGANILRNSDDIQRDKLVNLLDKLPGSSNNPNVKHNRFSLLASIVQHHDKFGVVSTGEAGLPIFSDILYFGSDNTKDSIQGIKKNITSVMVLNLADIAAVNTAEYTKRTEAKEIASKIYEIRSKINKDIETKNIIYSVSKQEIEQEQQYLNQLLEICKQKKSCLGLDQFKVNNVLEIWDILMRVIDDPIIGGSRMRVKKYLIDLEKNPNRAINRILRLLHESANRSNAAILNAPSFLSQTMVESVLVSILGAYQFESFSNYFAHIAKMDYALAFFRSILCACIRVHIHGLKPAEIINEELIIDDDANNKFDYSNILLDWEVQILARLEDPEKSKLSRRITSKFVKILESLTMRYAGVINPDNVVNPRRFGFNLRELTRDRNIMNQIIKLLCMEDDAKEPIALSWIVDEVTIWSFD